MLTNNCSPTGTVAYQCVVDETSGTISSPIQAQNCMPSTSTVPGPSVSRTVKRAATGTRKGPCPPGYTYRSPLTVSYEYLTAPVVKDTVPAEET